MKSLKQEHKEEGNKREGEAKEKSMRERKSEREKRKAQIKEGTNNRDMELKTYKIKNIKKQTMFH
jgi:hypothetical protein